MKTNRFILILLSLVLLQACKPEAIKPIGDVDNKIAAITGTWQLVSVIQKDEEAASKGFPYQVSDITSAFPYTDFKITFNSNATTPSTFTTTLGNAPAIISLASGTWAADDVVTPKVLTLTSGTQKQTITLGAYPNGASNKLKLSVERRDASSDKLLITYSYEFVKQ